MHIYTLQINDAEKINSSFTVAWKIEQVKIKKNDLAGLNGIRNMAVVFYQPDKSTPGLRRFIK